MMSCRTATQLMSESLDRPLTRKEKLNLVFHKLMCTGCRRFEHQLNRIRMYAHTFTKKNTSE